MKVQCDSGHTFELTQKIIEKAIKFLPDNEYEECQETGKWNTEFCPYCIKENK